MRQRRLARWIYKAAGDRGGVVGSGARSGAGAASPSTWMRWMPARTRRCVRWFTVIDENGLPVRASTPKSLELNEDGQALFAPKRSRVVAKIKGGCVGHIVVD